MRRTRFMSLFFLVLALAFFCLPEFRQAVRAPFTATDLASSWDQMEQLGRLPAPTLDSLAQTARQQKNAQTLAFVALNLRAAEQSVPLADEAVKIDPKYTWVYYWLATRYPKHPAVADWVKRVQTWDPENAIPYLLEAERTFEATAARARSAADLASLVGETDWRRMNQKAFAAPHYGTYAVRWFDLERTVLREQGLDRPEVMVVALASTPIPNLLNVRLYGRLLVEKLGKDAEQAGRPAEALAHYWTVAHFGERMQLQSRSLIEKLIATSLQKQAYERLARLLRQQGRAEEAASVQYALDALQQQDATLRGLDPLAQSSYYNWSALVVFLLAGQVLVFGAFTLACVAYVNTKRYWRTEKKGRLYDFLTTAENYMPILFFFACLGLYVNYYPYVQNYKHYMTASGETYSLEPFFYNVLPSLWLRPGGTELPIENPFFPYVWYALAGLVLMIGLMATAGRRSAAPGSQRYSPGR